VNGERAPLPILTTSDALPVIAETLPVMRLRRLLYKAVALPVGMMLLLCVLLGWQVAALVDENEDVAASQRVIGAAYQVQKLLIDHEAGMRGYLLTGDPELLQPYESARAQLPERLERLRALVGERPEQGERVAAIEVAYGEWMAAVDRPAGAARREPADAGLLAAVRARKQRMDVMRRLSAEVIDAETALLHAREQLAARQRRATIVGGTALLLAFGGFMATFVRRWFRLMESTYAKALARSVQSEAGERAARQAAEALAAEVTAQSHELAARLRTMRRELAAAGADQQGA
jgi:CHASE3 domain sensor protein